MAAPMTYDVILYDKGNPDKKLKYPLCGETSVCWFRLAGYFDDLNCEELDRPVLDSLVYSFNLEHCSLGLIEQMFDHFFGKCEYDVLYEVTKLKEKINDCTHQVFMTGFGDMPRGLFMNKMFMIRNLIRDEASTKVFYALLDAKVPFPVAAYLGGGMEMFEPFGGSPYIGIKEYAGYLNNRNHTFAASIRNMASNVYCEQRSSPWADGWGYNKTYNETEIIDTTAYYTEGDCLPLYWDSSKLWEMSAEEFTELVRLICQNDELTVTFD